MVTLITESSVTKTGTDSKTQCTSHGDQEDTDRWTNNISYRQLVVSSCIGIFQVWWHPYLHDFRRLIPFIFLYNVFSVLIGYPMFYMELALGVVTKKGVLDCWDLSPMTRGAGFAMIATCVFSAMSTSTVAAWCLALLVHSSHSFLPWLHCAATAIPPCAARHRTLTNVSETPAQSFLYNFVLEAKREGFHGGLGNIVRELSVYYVISWLLVYLITIKRIYSYSKIVFFKDVLCFFTLLCCVIGASQLKGASRMFNMCDWNVLLESFQIWRDAIEFALLEMTVSQGSLIMLGSFCPKQQHNLSQTAKLALMASKTLCMTTAFILGATHGALHEDYEHNINLHAGPTATIILWADYVARVPGSQFWSALVFFTLFVLALSTTALLIQTIMSTFASQSLRKLSWGFLIVLCSLLCFIGVITLCTQSGLYILNFLMRWPVTKTRIPVAAVISLVVTCAYGQTTFCENIYFRVGEYPCVIYRLSWAAAPVFLLAVFGSSMGAWPHASDAAGWLLVLVSLAPIVVVMLMYFIFRCRVRNILGTEK